MPGSENPVEEIGGIDTVSAFNKADLVGWAKANVAQVVENPDDLRARSMDGQNMVGIRSTGRIYYLDTTDTTTPDNGVWCVRDFDGLGYFSLAPEFIQAELAFGSAISLTSVTAANITSISLTAGDWLVWGNVDLLPSGTFTGMIGWISTTSASIPNSPNGGAYNGMSYSPAAGTGAQFPVGSRRYSLANTTTVYLSAWAAFASGTASAWGGIYAQRIR